MGVHYIRKPYTYQKNKVDLSLWWERAAEQLIIGLFPDNEQTDSDQVKIGQDSSSQRQPSRYSSDRLHSPR